MGFELNGSDPQQVFLAITALIFLGFLGNLIFSKLRLNDTLLLILVGILLGPAFGIIDPAVVIKISAIMGPLALILILFDGGMGLKFHDIIHGLGSAAALSFLGFILTMFAVAFVVMQFVTFSAPVGIEGEIQYVEQQVPFMTALILGAILAGTSALVVMPSLAHMKTERRTATTLGLESAITDILVVVVSFTLISIVAANQAIEAQGITSTLVMVFLGAIVIGSGAGLLWLYLYPGIKDKPFGYMLTLGAMFALYVVVEWLLKDVSSGGGPLAVLAFGVILGNHEGLWAGIRDRVGDGFSEGIRRFQGEISFLVRTFFFIYLGILVDFDLFKGAEIWLIGILVFAAMVLARYISVAITGGSITLKGDNKIIFCMFPRGLAAAVLAAVPAELGIPGTESFVAIAFLILVFTNLWTTVGALILEKASNKPAKAKPKQRKPKQRKEKPKKKGGKRDKGQSEEFAPGIPMPPVREPGRRRIVDFEDRDR